MQKGDLKTIRFAAVVCVICSLVLASVSSALRERQAENRKLDKQVNILKAFRPAIDPEGKPLSEEEQARLFDHGGISREMISAYFTKYVSEILVDHGGRVVEGKTSADYDPRVLENPSVEPNILYVWKGADGAPEKYAFPSQGKGLWSTVHAYIGLKGDLATIQGVTFFDHGETPGLGGECSTPWFQANFRGQLLFKDGEPTPFEVVKGRAADYYGKDDPQSRYAVDGISGATITGKGIQRFVRNDFKRYNAYFNTIR